MWHRYLFVQRCFNKINILSDETVRLDTGQNTNPLDVVYDEARKRVVVASADEEAHIIIFDSADKKVRSVPLAGFVGQGKSIGGAQGVTVDREKNNFILPRTQRSSCGSRS